MTNAIRIKQHVCICACGLKYSCIAYISQHPMTDDKCLTGDSLYLSPAMR